MEVSSCTFDEQRRVLEIAQEEVGDKLPLRLSVAGGQADGVVDWLVRQPLTLT
jgi:dihydrodipicolinate synthase/N-acetylneuraminate lyase